ncbi:MAG: galactokinase [Firmicutes bacterium]|nr:galactokinase [Bacillota bacterium]
MYFTEVKQKFIKIYGGEEKDIRLFSAPGRVNLMGEHTDYNGGYVFPAALTMRTVIAARKTDSKTINLAATDLPDRVSLDIENLCCYKDLWWGNYQAGVAHIMQLEGFDISGCDLLYDDSVPHGAGLSSSAAIEVATAFMLETFSNEKRGIDNKDIDLVRLAKISQRAEIEYAGVNCGIMDQFSSALGKKGHAIFLDCRDLSYEYVPISLDNKRIVIANTNKKRSLQTSKYNERRAECDIALKQLKSVLPDKAFLGEITVEEFLQYKKVLTNNTISKRAEHVIYETDRVVKSVAALKSGDMSTFGKLMNKSHNSLRDLYEVTGTELDTLVEEARKMEGVIGSRMTGAGFGGCTVSIVENDVVDEFIKTVGEAYKSRIGYEADFYISEIGDGAKELR